MAKTGDRFAALKPVYDAVTERFGELRADVARGISLCYDWGAANTAPTSAGAGRLLLESPA